MMRNPRFTTILGCFCSLVALAQTANGQQKRAPIPEPDFADIPYGPHERNVMDVWLAESDEPAPVVVYIHGGGFRGGDKRTGAGAAQSWLRHGCTFAAINYRLTDTAPAPAAYLDCGRAIQFLRSKAEDWNLDKHLFASTGGSAGGGTSLWLAFHDDLADPESEDPVSRESTRLTCVAVDSAQSSYDPRFVESFGSPRPNLERHGFFFPFYGIERDEVDSEEAYRLYEEMAPITYLTEDDPPVMLNYSATNRDADPEVDLGLVVHHPRFGILLKEEADRLGIECVVQYRKSEDSNEIVRHGGGEPIQRWAFILEQFKDAKNP